MDGYGCAFPSNLAAKMEMKQMNEGKEGLDLFANSSIPNTFLINGSKNGVRRSGFLASAFKGCKDGGKAISRLFSVGRQPFAQKGLFLQNVHPKILPQFCSALTESPQVSAPVSQPICFVEPSNGLSEAADHCGRQWRE